jgi:hypothetical protein
MPDIAARSRTNPLQAEIALLRACARAQISPEASVLIREMVGKGVDWLALIRLAMRHDVMPLLCRSLQQHCPDLVPANILTALRTRHTERAAEAHRRAEELVRLLTVLTKHGVNVVPYKGPALAQQLYGDVALREFGDLDVMIPRSEVRKAYNLVLSLGYQFAHVQDIGEFSEHLRIGRELQFYHPTRKIHLELHWHFAMRLACISKDPERFLDRLDAVAISGNPLPSLTLENYFLVLSIHATKHRWRQLKLVCDIVEILGRNDIDWQYVASQARSLRIKRMLSVGVLLAADLLDANVPELLSRGLRPDRMAHTLANEVRRTLFDEPDTHWQDQADLTFQLQSRERLWDKGRMLCVHIPVRLAPDERDRRFLNLPDFLSPLYFLTRPLRWALQKGPAR